MGRKLFLMVLTVFVAVAAMPGIAAADDDDDDEHEGDDRQAVYLSLGDSLAMGSLADASGTTTFPSRKSYTDRLSKKLRDRFDGDLQHVKLGCDGEKTTDMIYGLETKCDDAYVDYVTGTQLGDAVMWLSDPTVDVVLVTITIGANDINHLGAACSFDPGCIGAGVSAILDNLGIVLHTLRNIAGYDGPIVGTKYYNPNVAASIGFFAGAPGPLDPNPNPGFAGLSDFLTQEFNAGLEYVYSLFGAQAADVYSAFRSGDFGDDGGRFQKANNGVPDNADAVCRLTYMCPDEFGPGANIHPTPKGYKVMAKAFWMIVRRLDLGDDD